MQRITVGAVVTDEDVLDAHRHRRAAGAKVAAPTKRIPRNGHALGQPSQRETRQAVRQVHGSLDDNEQPDDQRQPPVNDEPRHHPVAEARQCREPHALQQDRNSVPDLHGLLQGEVAKRPEHQERPDRCHAGDGPHRQGRHGQGCGPRPAAPVAHTHDAAEHRAGRRVRGESNATDEQPRDRSTDATRDDNREAVARRQSGHRHDRHGNQRRCHGKQPANQTKTDREIGHDRSLRDLQPTQQSTTPTKQRPHRVDATSVLSPIHRWIAPSFAPQTATTDPFLLNATSSRSMLSAKVAGSALASPRDGVVGP